MALEIATDYRDSIQNERNLTPKQVEQDISIMCESSRSFVQSKSSKEKRKAINSARQVRVGSLCTKIVTTALEDLPNITCKLKTKPQPKPKVVLTSEEVKLTHLNRSHIAKLPVAFGFSVDDGDSPKYLARIATEKFAAQGVFSTKSDGSIAIAVQADSQLVEQTTKRKRKNPTVSQSNPKIAMASDDLQLTNFNRNDVAKLPVATGFWLNDAGTSLRALHVAMGEQVVKSETVKHGKWFWLNDAGASLRALHVALGKQVEKCETVKHGKCSDSNKCVRSAGQELPKKFQRKKTRRNICTPPFEPAGRDFPAGWTVQTFKRSDKRSGNTRSGSTYKIFSSAANKVKFRSMKSVLLFVQILNEPGIFDEKMALAVFKRRGHKL